MQETDQILESIAHSATRTSVHEKFDLLKRAETTKNEGLVAFQKAGEEDRGSKTLFEGGTGPWAELSRKFAENTARMEAQVRVVCVSVLCVCVSLCVVCRWSLMLCCSSFLRMV